MQPPTSSTSSSQSPDQASQPETPATGSSSGGGSSNPLYPSILPTSATLLATKLGPTLPYYRSQTQAFAEAAAADPEQVRREAMEARQRAMPEKCFSWCTQSEMARPFCRMVCLRKREKGVGLGMTREERLERLRPRQQQQQRIQVESASADALASVISRSSSSSSSSMVEWIYSPIATLRSRLTPYSIIYVRGTPDGVIGRYMEELEWDDGVYDFKGLSRGQVAKSAGGGSGRGRGEDEKMEWLEWGDHG